MVKNKVFPQEKNIKPTNGWDFLIKVTDLAYDLINTGNIIGAGFFFFIVWILVISLKMPPDELGPFVRLFVKILSKANTAYYILGSGIAVSLSANLYMYKTYKAEIKRLVDQRKLLIHGLEKGFLSEIEKHTSCDTDL